MSDTSPPRLQLHAGTAVWSGGDSRGTYDLWLLPEFGDSHLCYGEAFNQPIASRARIHAWDLPGHGASPPQPAGLTVARSARLLRDLIAGISGDRQVVLLAHSSGAVVAIVAAQLLDTPPMLLINVEGSLAPEDGPWCSRAEDFDSAADFIENLRDQILAAAPNDPVRSRYWRSLRLVDPPTLWSLCRSVLAYRNAGDAYLRLPCPTIYYRTAAGTPAGTRHFLARHRPAQRELPGPAHWPMVRSPTAFYRLVEEDVERHRGAPQPVGGALLSRSAAAGGFPASSRPG